MNEKRAALDFFCVDACGNLGLQKSGIVGFEATSLWKGRV